MGCKTAPDEYDFSSTFDTYIIACCPDVDMWFVTNKRFFYYEYPMEFPNEEAGIAYFKRNPNVFLKLEKQMDFHKPKEYKNSVWLDNTEEWIKVDEVTDEQS